LKSLRNREEAEDLTSQIFLKALPLKQTMYRGEIPMDSKVYLDEKVRQAHSQDLLREAEKRRLLAQLPRHRSSISRRAAGKFGVLLLKLGSWLKQFEQSPTALEDH
jgi:hypothetical protein